VGFVLGTWLIWSDGLKPIHTLAWGDSKVSIYTGLIALVANIVVVLIVNPLSRRPTVTVMSRT
jgi:SSS family solute:Na+ symporter